MMLPILSWTALCRRREIHHQFRTVPRRWCAAMSCGGENFSPDGAYDSALDSVMPMKGNTPSITSSTHVDVGCVCMLNWICSIDGFCADNHNYFQFKLDGKGRSAGSAATQVRSVEIQSCSHSCFCAWWQYTAKVVEVHVVQLLRCSSWIDGLTFLVPCTQVHGQGFPPPSGRGRGGGDAGSLLPGVLPPN